VIYRLDSAAVEELREAVKFYREEQGTVLAREFLAEFRRVMGLLLEFPKMGVSAGGGFRKFRLGRFRRSVVYEIIGDELHVLAVYHHSRRPDYWRKN
jgi:toxin ParE1/3/4